MHVPTARQRHLSVQSYTLHELIWLFGAYASLSYGL
jgi:hypothetical protein